MTPNEIKIQKLLKSNHVEDYMNDVSDVGVNAVFIEPVEEIKNESEFTLGETKMYGQPHFPSSLPWPKGKDGDGVLYPLVFLMQVNFGQVAKILPDIPQACNNGILYFFISSSFDELSKNITGVVSKDAYKVLFYNGPTQRLAVLPYPKVPEDVLETELDYTNFKKNSQKVSIRKDISLLSSTRLVSGYVPPEVLKDWHKYQQCCFDPAFSTGVQLFGYTVPVQSSPEQDDDEYVLLASLVGPWDKTFYFYITKADLKQGIFTNIELVMQYS